MSYQSWNFLSNNHWFQVCRHLRRKVESTSYHWIGILGLGWRGGYMVQVGFRSVVSYHQDRWSVSYLRCFWTGLWISSISPFLRGACCSRVVQRILNMMFLGVLLQLHWTTCSQLPENFSNQTWESTMIHDFSKRTSSEVLYLTFLPPKNIPKTHPKIENCLCFFGVRLPEKHPHIHFKPEKKTEKTVSFWRFCWPPVDSNPRERPRAKMLGQGPDVKALQHNEGWNCWKWNLPKLLNKNRWFCFTFYLPYKWNVVSKYVPFCGYFSKINIFCSSGNLTDLFVGHQI